MTFNKVSNITFYVLSKLTMPTRTPTRGVLAVKGGEKGAAGIVWLKAFNFSVPFNKSGASKASVTK